VVQLALLAELARQGAFEEARVVAQSFLAAHAQDPRASEVRAFERKLRRSVDGR
jgi:hypothetical protein